MVKTLERVFKIIDLLESKDELKLQEIANYSGIHKSTVSRFLKTLLEYNYIKKNKENLKYSLGIKFVNISSIILKKLDLRNIVHPYLIELGKLTGEATHLVIFDGNVAVYIDKVESEHPIQMYSRIGNIVPLYCTAVGKIILAFQDDELINTIIDDIKFVRHSDNTIIDKEVLKKTLTKIRIEKVAVDRGENEEGIICIAAPIFHHNKKVNASISISAVKSRIDLETLLQYKDILLEKSNIISKELGYF